MPQISVKSFAEVMACSAGDQLRVLRRLKETRETSSRYPIVYYSSATKAIRDYYRAGRDAGELDKAIRRLRLAPETHRTRNNIRAIEAFRDSQLFGPPYELQTSPRCAWTVGDTTINCTPDLVLQEGGENTYVLLNLRTDDPPDETVRIMLELTQHILQEGGIEVPLRKIVYVSLESDTIKSWLRPRVRTLQRAQDTALVVSRLWDNV